MIIPTKHISANRSLVGQGAILLALFDEREHTVSSLWDAFLETTSEFAEVTFDWFVLALDFLYTIGAIELDQGIIVARKIQ